jgi:outer membrane protein OmpA-like peptidoglycan-associated protein
MVIMYGQKPLSIKIDQLSDKEKTTYLEGIKLSKKGMAKEAMKNFDKVLKKQPLFLEAKLRKAGLHYDAKDFATAKKTIEEVIAQDSSYDAEMYFAIGLCDKNLKNYRSASKYYNQYLQHVRNLSDDKIKKLKHEIETYDFRANAYEHPQTIDPKPIEGLVNTNDLEYLPSLTIDGSLMVFTRRIRSQENLYISRNNNGTWGVAVPIESINTNDNVAAHAIREDGNAIAFTTCNNKITGFGSCDLYISTKENNKWSQPANMGNKVNSAAWDSQPSFINNGNTLIFSSDRKGSIGGRDLWMISKGKNGKWQEAVNLGNKINSTANEESPFFHPDGKTLFFKSDGHIGMGASDIFYAKYDAANQAWSAPVNLGYPINTEGDEGAFFVDAKGQKAYYATDIATKDKANANLDIYSFDLPVELRPEPVSYIKVSIIDEKNKKAISANFSIIDLATKDTVSQGTAIDGMVLTAIGQNKNYALLIDKENYYFHSENFNTMESYDVLKPYEITVTMRPVLAAGPEAPVILKNIFFKSGSAVLMTESQTEIDKLYNFLLTNDKAKIKIIGHTDNVGSDADNLKLSEQRAKAVQDALIAKGIVADRLTFEGKGKSLPIADNATEEGRKINRRTEFIIVK